MTYSDIFRLGFRSVKVVSFKKSEFLAVRPFARKLCSLCLINQYKAEDLDDEELALAVMGLEKWFRREIEEGLFKHSKQASRVTFQKWTKV